MTTPKPGSRHVHGRTVVTTDPIFGDVVLRAPRRVESAPSTLLHDGPVEGRADLVAATFLGDASLAWVICDANAVLHPRDVESRLWTPLALPGRRPK